VVDVLLHKVRWCLCAKVARDCIVLELSNLSHKARKGGIHEAKSRDEVGLLKQQLPACCNECCGVRLKLVK
jgi:hypothetical protein